MEPTAHRSLARRGSSRTLDREVRKSTPMSRVRQMRAPLIAALVLLVPLAEEPLLRADGPTLQRVVVFDEGHFNFHTTRGSYSQFAELLRKDGHTIIARPEPLDRKALAQAQLLVIADALSAEGNSAERGTLPWRWTRNAALPAFTSNECDAAEEWVREGGGLLLIVDHPPYPAAARDLARRFGVEVRNASTHDPTPGNHAQTTSTLVFTRSNGLLGDHAITRGSDPAGRINAITTFTGSSLAGPPNSTAFLKLSEAAYDQFFESAGAPEQRTSAKGRAQGVALQFGKGRVVVLGEAAMFRTGILEESAEGGFANRQLALNIVRWLSRLPE